MADNHTEKQRVQELTDKLERCKFRSTWGLPQLPVLSIR